MDTPAKEKELQGIRLVSHMRDGPRRLCVMLAGIGDELLELRWTYGRKQAVEWIASDKSIAVEESVAVYTKLVGMPEDDGPSYAVSGPIGGHMAEAFSVGTELVAHGFHASVGALVAVYAGANVGGREGMALVLHAEEHDRHFMGALLENKQSLYEYYMANARRIHHTDDYLGPGVRGELIIPIPDPLTIALMAGLTSLFPEESPAVN